MRWRRIIVSLNVLLFLGLIGAAFWYQDWRYSLPTPPPKGWTQPALDARIDLRGTSLDRAGLKDRPLFLHFFNPECPCSRFNIDHVRTLIRDHGSTVRFVAVLQGERAATLQRSSFEELRLGIDSVVDEDGRLGALTGVYTTPQAVLLDSRGGLYYRGNYNLSRFCTAPETEFARIALESLRSGRSRAPVPPAATTAYGCPRRVNRSAT